MLKVPVTRLDPDLAWCNLGNVFDYLPDLPDSYVQCEYSTDGEESDEEDDLSRGLAYFEVTCRERADGSYSDPIETLREYLSHLRSERVRLNLDAITPE